MKSFLKVFIVLIVAGCNQSSINSSDKQNNNDSIRDSLKESAGDSASDANTIMQMSNPEMSFNQIIQDINEMGNSVSERKPFIFSKRYIPEIRRVFYFIDSLSQTNTRSAKCQVTMLYNNARYYEIDTIIGYIAQKGFSPVQNQAQIISVPVSEWERFSGTLAISRSGYVYYDSFNKTSFTRKYREGSPYDTLPRYFGMCYPEQRYLYADTMIALMPDEGFESIRHILTVWKQKNDDYKLITILDHWLHVAIGGIWVEQTMNLNSRQILLIGKSYGGDEGDSWGTLWVGLWTKPRQFKVIFEDGWGTVFGDTIVSSDLSYQFDKQRHILNIQTESYRSAYSDGSDHPFDSSFCSYSVWVDTLLKKDITLPFNFGYQQQ